MLKKIKLDIYLIPTIIWSIMFLTLSFNRINTSTYIEKIGTQEKLILFSLVALIYALVLNGIIKKYFLSFFIPIIPALYIYTLNYKSIISEKKLVLIIIIALFSYLAKKISSSTLIKIILYIGYFILSLLLTLIFYLSYYTLFNNTEIYFIFKILLTFLVILLNLFFLDEKEYSSKYLNILFIIFITAIFILIYSFMFSGFLQSKYSAASIIILCSTYPLLLSYFIFNKKWILIFNILPLIFLSYYVITNIKVFGVTENRYFTLFFGIIALIFTILALINKIKANNIFISLCILSIIVFYTPYINAFDVTKKSLITRYNTTKNLSEKNNIYYYGKDRLWNLQLNINEKDGNTLFDKDEKTFEITEINKYSKIKYIYSNELNKNEQIKFAKKIIENKLENGNETIVPIAYLIEKNLENDAIYIHYFKILILTK
ncbi:DUF4153 domain-containing protein [Caviibacter abscessus]|uniref:DUF4153 domain-containing protein n=1 Tax=Caviibacter abscessus TaxID=1766719 RepID=UPI000830BE98|nr:DUF4153 domain-containing protein [Caviibacter abscessus]